MRGTYPEATLRMALNQLVLQIALNQIMRGFSDVEPNTWSTQAAANDGSMLTWLEADPLNVKLPPAILELRKNYFSIKI